MGLLLSILVGCVGVLELLSSLKRVSNEASITSSGPTTPCLSYHGSAIDNPSFHDSLCGISHSGDIPVPKSARRKLENLHEYSLRVRSELRSFGGSDWSTLSDCSTRDLLSQSRTDSRHSLNFDLLLEDQEDAWTSRGSTGVEGTTIFIEYDDSAGQDDKVVIEEMTDQKTATTADHPDRYVRIPTPIPLGMASEISRSNSSLDHYGTFENESGNEAPTRMSFDQAPVVLGRYGDDDSSSSPGSSIDEGDDISSRVRKKGFTRISRSRSPEVAKTGHRDQVLIKSTPKFLTNEVNMGYEISMNESERVSAEAGTSMEQVEGGSAKSLGTSQKRIRSSRTASTVLRKPTRLKSKNAEISKSADNLTGKRTKRQREPERRRSDISVQTIKDSLRDEWTNTSPTDSEASIYASRTSVSVEVQTSFDDQQLLSGGIDDQQLLSGGIDDQQLLSGGIGDYRSPMSFEMPVIGLSESRRDVGVTIGRKAFKNRRFANAITTKSRSLDDYTTTNWAPLEIDSTVVGGPKDPPKTDNRKKLDANEQRNESNGWRSRGKDTSGEQKRTPSFTEEDSVDEEFLDAEELIFSGEYTKAMNKDWHSGHFCCWQCDESLTGQRYVLRDEHPYCIKCYESVFANGCEECSKIIGIDSKDLSYKDKHWHEACFLCNKCRVSLVDKQFGSKVDKIYCGNCYDAQFASRCDGCGEIFRAGTYPCIFLFNPAGHRNYWRFEAPSVKFNNL